MKTLSTTLIILLAVISFNCSKKAEPKACLTANKTTVVAAESISFTNCSQNSNTFVWDFGDGTTSTDNSPSHSYEGTGDYVVKVTAYNDDETTSNTAQINIKVGKRTLKGFVIKAINFYDGKGKLWDASIDNTGPDILVSCAPTSKFSTLTSRSNSNLHDNTQASELPLTIDMPSETIELTQEGWTFQLYEKDAGLFKGKQMCRWDNIDMSGQNSSPINIKSSTNGNWDIDIVWEIK
ncbi:MAG: PKD domain-containing protein [Bacteroidetes bacterium]|nr:PKD domain-containing protein [Bacteroidota bacterium]